MNRRAILIVGPHRSGTSVVTRALCGAGVELGRTLLESNSDNPKGFFENARVVAFNDRLLKHLGMCWDYLGPGPQEAPGGPAIEPWLDEAQTLLDEEFGSAGCIGVKDPRLCLLAPFWDLALQRHGFQLAHVLVIRHPEECARSQQARWQRDPSHHFVGGDLAEGMLLWGRYLHEALTYLRDKSFAVASHCRFLADPEQAQRQLCQALGLSADPDAAADFGRAFVDRALHRQRRDLVHEDGPQAGAYERIYDRLNAVRGDRLYSGQECGDIISALSELLGPAELLGAVLRTYARARHAAVEANLELAEAKRILAYQESALAAAERRAADVEQRAEAAKILFAQERAKCERLSLELAALTDRAEQLRTERRQAGGQNPEKSS
ncbi:MAG: hypothetical protein AB1651_07015 [Pseudomonadota bacterium]